jgi:hypothetical protein
MGGYADNIIQPGWLKSLTKTLKIIIPKLSLELSVL